MEGWSLNLFESQGLGSGPGVSTGSRWCHGFVLSLLWYRRGMKGYVSAPPSSFDIGGWSCAPHALSPGIPYVGPILFGLHPKLTE